MIKVVQGLKKLPKTMQISAFSYNFQINQIENSTIQIQKLKDWTLSFQLKNITSSER